MRSSDQGWKQKRLFYSVLAFSVWLGNGFIPNDQNQVFAQITPDNTLGQESSQVTPNAEVQDAPATLIEGGAIRGAHLFHSFSTFNVSNGQRVYFANPAGTLNIFSRVTGDSVSNIRGTLGVDGMANLYLLNPNGIVFGPNAQLDVSGSFVASTANRLVFDDGQFFGALPANQPPLLQINVTPGLQYGNNLNATIRNQGNLQAGQNLTLGAQRLDLAGSLEAGRDITLQGWIRDLGDADYTVGGYVFTQNLDGQGIDLLIPHENVIVANGDVRLTQNYEGESLHVLAGGQVSRAAGANNITITGTSGGGSVTEQITTGTGGLQTVTVTASDQPTVDIRSGVDWAQLTGGLPGNSNTSEAVVTFGATTGEGIALRNITNNGGDIALWAAGNIAANNLNTSVSISSSISEDVQGADGGAISLVAGQNIFLDSVDSSSDSNSDIGEDVQGADGGAISRVAGQNIFLDSVDSSSDSLLLPFFGSNLGDVTGGDGGAISLVAGHNISLGSIDSYSKSDSDSYSNSNSDSFSFSGDVMGEDGGTISLVAGHNISLGSIDSSASAYSYSSLSSGDAIGGDGGTISLVAGQDISLNSLNSYSYSFSNSYSYSYSFSNLNSDLSLSSGDVTGGDGGAISLIAGQDISLVFINSSSSSNSSLSSSSNSSLSSGDVTGGDGGAISLIAGQDISLNSLNSYSESYSSSFSSSSSGDVTGGDGGAIFLVAGQDVSLDYFIDSSSDSFSSSFSPSFSPSSLFSGDVTGGDGGAISLIAGQNISLESFKSSSNSSSNSFSPSYSSLFSADVTGGDGGAISLFAGQDISLDYSDSYSESFSSSEDVTGGDGGAVSLVAGQDISLDSINSYSSSYSSSEDVTGGDGGAISLKAETGSILVFRVEDFSSGLGNPSFRSFSVAEGDSSGNGGAVTLEAATQVGIENSDYSLEILTLSSSAQSGTVQIVGLGENLDILNTSITASKTVEIENPSTGGTITIPVGEKGQSGNVNISGSGSLTFTNSSFLSDTNGSDPAGNVTIQSPGAITFINSSINTNTQSTGAAGNIEVTAPQITLQQGSEITTSTTNAGSAGNITFNTKTLAITDGSEILATTSGSGSSGTVIINATDSVLLGEGVQNFAPVISVETSGSGTAGDIFINTPNFVLSETARITATATETATNSQGGGSITISADHMNLAGIVGIFAETAGQSPGGVLTLQPYQNHPNLDILLAPGAQISASTYSSGTGGDLIVTAPQSITISGAGELAVETFGTGTAGNITITTDQLLLTDGITLSASTNGAGTAGNITLNAEDLTIQNGAQVLTNTSGSGDAGDIKFNVSNVLDINNNATVQASTETGSTGNGGDINIDPTLTLIRNGGSIAVNSAGQGQGGSIFLTSDNLFLNRGAITAETATSNGGNIELNIQNLMVMENFSLISASAGTEQAGGDGGNITINIPNGFLIAPMGADSDIIAQAYEGTGGNIDITARGIYGFAEQPAVRGNGINDIDASSQFGQSGVVSVNDLLIDPSQDVVELPANVLAAEQLIDRSCQVQSEQQLSSFVFTGRGGLPPTPEDSVRNTSAFLEDLGPAIQTTGSRELFSQSGLSHHDDSADLVSPTSPNQIIEAQTWIRNASGQLVLQANVPQANNAERMGAATFSCQ